MLSFLSRNYADEGWRRYGTGRLGYRRDPGHSQQAAERRWAVMAGRTMIGQNMGSVNMKCDWSKYLKNRDCSELWGQVIGQSSVKKRDWSTLGVGEYLLIVLRSDYVCVLSLHTHAHTHRHHLCHHHRHCCKHCLATRPQTGPGNQHTQPCVRVWCGWVNSTSCQRDKHRPNIQVLFAVPPG